MREPARPVLPYGRQDVDEADVEAVVRVLRSDFLTQGPTVGAFEAALAERAGAPHAVAVNSATSALHLACLALGIGPGDEVWTTSITFVASANCARLCGAEVRFVDIDPLFDGHRVCAGSNAWVNGVRVPLHHSFHPNATGYRHICERIFGRLT